VAHSFAFIDSEGDPKGLISGGSDDQYVHLQAYGDTQAVIVSSEADNDSIMVTGWYNLDTNEWSTRVACPAPYYVWENKQWTFNSERFWVDVRQERDLKLAQSDWTQIADSPLSGEAKAEWATYRQALRNVPANNQSATSTEGVSWPTGPGG
jgi:hypothetical protein